MVEPSERLEHYIFQDLTEDQKERLQRELQFYGRRHPFHPKYDPWEMVDLTQQGTHNFDGGIIGLDTKIGRYVYHATSEENVENILRDGLRESRETVGLGSDTGDAVFATPYRYEAEKFGDTVLRIDLKEHRDHGGKIALTEDQLEYIADDSTGRHIRELVEYDDMTWEEAEEEYYRHQSEFFDSTMSRTEFKLSSVPVGAIETL